MKKRKALTLIEIILAMLILGMITVVFLTIFNTGNRNIATSGDGTQVSYEIQEQLDNRIKDSGFTVNNTVVELDQTSMSITVEIKVDGITPHEVKGKLITGREKDKEDGIEITTFVPD